MTFENIIINQSELEGRRKRGTRVDEEKEQSYGRKGGREGGRMKDQKVERGKEGHRRREEELEASGSTVRES